MTFILALILLLGLGSEVLTFRKPSSFIQSTCPAVQQTFDEVEQSYNDLFYNVYTENR